MRQLTCKFQLKHLYNVPSILMSSSYAVRQMVMFSATWPLAVHQLSQEFMDPNPVKVCLFVRWLYFLNVAYMILMYGWTHAAFTPYQVVVGSEDLAANHDVMQIVEVRYCSIFASFIEGCDINCMLSFLIFMSQL